MIHARSVEKPMNQKIINLGAVPRTTRPRREPYTVDRYERDGYIGPNICIRGINVIIGIVDQIYDNDGRSGRFDVSHARLLARGSTPYTPVNIAWYCSRRRLLPPPPPPPLAKEAFENSCESVTRTFEYRRYLYWILPFCSRACCVANQFFRMPVRLS